MGVSYESSNRVEESGCLPHCEGRMIVYGPFERDIDGLTERPQEPGDL